MRVLVACAACKRQFDVSGMRVGAGFHCACGEIIRVPEVEAQDAAVVRCRSCGAAREGDALACGYCSADFTLHEQDLQTICPSCMARISDRSRYCHHCATPIVSEGKAGELSDRVCPVCGPEHRMSSRALGRSGVAMLECTRCAGIWLGQETFRQVVERARAETGEEPDLTALRDASRPRARAATQPGGLYRRCPVCSQFMLRKNYARRSGVIIDICSDHGMWFDAQELDSILRWVKHGGELVAVRRDRQEQREAERRARFRVEPKAPEGGRPFSLRDGADGADLVTSLLGSLFDL